MSSSVEKISSWGYRSLFGGWNSDRELKDYIINNIDEFPDVTSLVLKDDDLAGMILSYYYERGKTLDVNGPFGPYIERMRDAATLDMSKVFGWNSQFDRVLKALSMIEDYDWLPLFHSATSWVRTKRIYGDTFGSILKEVAKRNPKEFLQYGEETIFNGGAGFYIRGAYYSALIEAGLLDKKMARKMRSEASEEASQRAVNSLLDASEELYPNRDQLLIVFSDSKHQRVIQELANKLPKHLLYSVLGTEFSWFKRTIEDRMQNAE